MTKPRILVTTPNGRTGSATVHELLRRGFPVRALVRRDDQRAAKLRQAGVEVLVGDMFDWRDLRRALDDVQRAYHCPPFDSRLLHSATLFALAAEEAKLEAVALMSGWNPHPIHPSIVQREHWLANNLYRRLSVDVIHVNPGIFAFTYLLGLPSIVHLGMLALPYGDGLNAPPSNEDIGAVAAGVLANPAPYVGRCVRPTGPELISPHDAAETLTKLLGRKVRYRAVSIEMFAKAAKALGFPTFQIAQMCHYAEELREGVYAGVTDHVHEVTGLPPENFETSARRYVAEPWRIDPRVGRGTLAGALALTARMLVTPAPDLARWESTRDYPLISDGVLAHESPEWRRAAAAGRLVLQSDSVARRDASAKEPRSSLTAA